MTKGTDWNPLAELLNVQKRMNDLFETALARSNYDTHEGLDSWTPVCDAYATTDRLVLCLELPGFHQKDIDLRIEGDELIVEGNRGMDREQDGEHFHRVERSYGRFSRRFNLPSSVDRDAVQASYRYGVLRVELPVTAGRRPQSLHVEIG